MILMGLEITNVSCLAVIVGSFLVPTLIPCKLAQQYVVYVYVCGVLAAYDFPSFKFLITSEPILDTNAKLAYLKDISAHRDFLRLILIKWYMTKKIEFSDLYHDDGRR